MPLINFIFGFLSGLVLILFFLYWLNRQSKVEPWSINDVTQLQDVVGRLYREGKNGAILYVVDRQSEFSVRIIKMERKTKANTLKVEIRASDKNAGGYPIVREALEQAEIEFEEKFTPKLKRSSRLYLKDDDGGVFTVSGMTQAVSTIMKLVGNSENLDILASEQSPHFWKPTQSRA